MNTTPLIDVMLVLLVMFIITIPIQTHAVKIDLPTSAASSVRIDPVFNVLEIDPSGTALWNLQPITLVDLQKVLEETKALNPVPELRVKPDPAAPFAPVDEVFVVIKRAEIQKMGFVGNENYRDWAASGTGE